MKYAPVEDVTQLTMTELYDHMFIYAEGSVPQRPEYREYDRRLTQEFNWRPWQERQSYRD
jgi:hypothetical protein